jgi:hypothetical protein
VVLDVEDVAFDDGFDLFGPVCILEGVEGVFVGAEGRRYVGNHHSAAVAPKRVFQQPRQFRVPVGYKFGA